MKKKEMKAKIKPLSFDTTMRNPERIAGFLNCLLKYEGMILTNDIIHKIVKSVINEKLYWTMYEKSIPEYKTIYLDEEKKFTDAQLEDIVRNSPQDHKEAGYDKGWPSRFETWFNLPKEYGFVWYRIGEKISISQTGHMLIDAFNADPVDNQKIQNVFLNTMCRYQTANPFRKTLMENVPFLLLLKVIKRLKDEDKDSSGIFRQELSFFISWPNADDEELFNYIKDFRRLHRYSQYTDEIIYNHCLKIMGYGNNEKNYIKMSKIAGETVDEYIRKMKITGVISLRGNGRFIDFNTLFQDKIDYILNNYQSYKKYQTEKDYFDYMAKVDPKLFEEEIMVPSTIAEIRKTKLYELAETLSKELVIKELTNLSKKKESSHEMLKFINKPARLEFLTSIALVQNFANLDVNPNYPIDDEGLPTYTAGPGIADIICKDENNELVEVTMMCDKNGQVNNEMLPITRHQDEARKDNPDTFSVFVAPSIHPDTARYIKWIKQDEDIDIKAFTIEDFIKTMSSINNFNEILAA